MLQPSETPNECASANIACNLAANDQALPPGRKAQAGSGGLPGVGRSAWFDVPALIVRRPQQSPQVQQEASHGNHHDTPEEAPSVEEAVVAVKRPEPREQEIGNGATADPNGASPEKNFPGRRNVECRGAHKLMRSAVERLGLRRRGRVSPEALAQPPFAAPNGSVHFCVARGSVQRSSTELRQAMS